MVSQDPHLFHDTVGANLRYARPDATDDEMIEACRAAQILEVIEALPDGFDTVVGERGYRLSGGEKQRLAIARMLLKDPAVVILDEATSHLDSENEALVQDALASALSGRTAIVIAHRLSTITAADQILVLDARPDRRAGRPPPAAGPRRPLRRPVPHPGAQRDGPGQPAEGRRRLTGQGPPVGSQAPSLSKVNAAPVRASMISQDVAVQRWPLADVSVVSGHRWGPDCTTQTRRFWFSPTSVPFTMCPGVGDE